MRPSKRTLGLVGATALALGFLAPSAAHAEETAPPSQDVGEQYRETTDSEAVFGYTPGSTSDSLSSVQPQAASFTGVVHADWPHKSGGDASGHVWWELTSGTNQLVTLTSTLKARTSWFTFRTMAGPTAAEVFAGGGRGKFAVARYACNNNNERDWYVYGTATAPGAPDPFGEDAGDIKPVACEGGLD